MSVFHFPSQNSVLGDKPYSPGLLKEVLANTFASPNPFTGFLKVDDGAETLYFLFLFKSDPYAAGKFTGIKHYNITISDFFFEIRGCTPDKTTISQHETDPVLIKNMLIFLQGEPTVKAPTNLIDLERITGQIASDGTDALIILAREHRFNFFFFKSGKAALAHFADTTFEIPEGLSREEQLLLYAFQPGARVDAYVYRDIKTEQASDAESVSREGVVALIGGDEKQDPKTAIASMGKAMSPAHEPKHSEPPPSSSPLKQPHITLTFIEGKRVGERLSVKIPCTIGRKDGDLIINDTLLSRRHAELKIVDGKLVIVDLGSTNGTFVNGNEVKNAVLRPNDVITLGETLLKVGK